MSFSTIQRKNFPILATLRKALNSTIPVLPISVSRHFWAAAYVCIGASPNKCIQLKQSILLWFHHTLYLQIKLTQTKHLTNYLYFFLTVNSNNFGKGTSPVKSRLNYIKRATKKTLFWLCFLVFIKLFFKRFAHGNGRLLHVK